MNNTIKLLLCLVITLGIGLSASVFTISEIYGWFATIRKPGWNPPNGVFGPVWTLLYILMGIALYLVWIKPAAAARKRTAVIAFAAQMALNFLWSYFFFHFHDIEMAFYDIVLLWVLILLTIFAFSRINKIASWLLVPYISWVSFAAILNYTILQLNK